MFAALYSPGPDASAPLAAAQAFSPRIEQDLGGRLVLIDAAGLTRIVGDAEAIARELSADLVARHARGVHVAVAPARVAALLLAVARPYHVVLPGRTAAAVGALAIDVFETLAGTEAADPSTRSARRRPAKRSCPLCRLCGARACGQPGGACTELPTLRRWGIATLAELASLPSAQLSARLGQAGVALQRLARGLDTQPLVPIVDEARFEAAFDLEWPVDNLQPLSFVLTRLLDPLSAALARADRGAAAVETTLTLVTVREQADGSRTRETHARRLELPAPMRDARVLRTLILLDLESHPPAAGIDRVGVRLEPTPARIVQFSLLERAGPQPETVATLTSRLTALMGEGRVGSPAVLDSHAPDAFALRPFAPTETGGQEPGRRPPTSDPTAQDAARETATPGPGSPDPTFLPPVLRRFRIPVVARVAIEEGRPVRVTTERIGIRGGAVRQCAGPWRSSGAWWSACAPPDTPVSTPWDRDEYDVWLADGAAYRLYRDRHDDVWFVEGILD